MSANCIFCKICKKQAPSLMIYEDPEIVVFQDIKPMAKNHYLVVPTEHIQDISKLTADHKHLLEKMIDVGKQMLSERGCDMSDCRLGFHVPPFNTVKHLHLHLLCPVSELSVVGRTMFMPNSYWFKTADIVLDSLSVSKM